MNQNSISDLPRLRSDSYESIFNVHLTEDGYYYYNLLQTLSLPENLPAGYFDTYTITYGDTWPFISYKTYKTPNLWWLILYANNIINPVEPLQPGTQIRTLKTEVVKIIISQLITQRT